MVDAKRIRLFVAVAAVWPTTRALAQSCAMCGSSFGQNDPVQRAFSWSILFLMATPYSIVGGVALWLFYLHRRAAGRRRSALIDLGQIPRTAPVEGPGGGVS